MNVVYYARVSTEEEQQLNALQTQIEMLEEYIDSVPEWRLTDRYVDEGKSGTTTKGRKEYQRLYEDLDNDSFDIVVIKDETRLSRHPLTWYQFIDKLIKREKKLFFLNTKTFYSPDDEFIMTIKAGMASQYSRELSKKVNMGHKQRQKKGVVITNGSIWGYKQKNGELIIDDREAEIVRTIFRMYADGKGFRTIANELEKAGIRNHNNNQFSLTTLKRMIRNEKYKGILICNKKHKDFDTKKISLVPESEWIIHVNGVPAIISEDLWNKANEILDGKKTKYNKEAKQKTTGCYKGRYIYSGRIICGKCGEPYYHQKYKTMKNDLWQCKRYREYGKNSEQGCNNAHIFTYELDKLIKEVIFDIWQNKEEFISSTIQYLDRIIENNNYESDIKVLKAERDKIEMKIDNLIEMRIEGDITKEEFTKKKDEFDKQLARVTDKLKHFEGIGKRATDKKQRLDEISSILKKQLIDKLTFSTDDITNEIIDICLEQVIVKGEDELEIRINGNEAFESIIATACKNLKGYTYQISPLHQDKLNRRVDYCNRNKFLYENVSDTVKQWP